ncbi:MAG TPA: septal ring lytic transglycosylase RlpA family protein [Solirubrobacteraceae bacterium]
MAALAVSLALSACGSSTQGAASGAARASATSSGSTPATTPGSSVATTPATTAPSKDPARPSPEKPRHIAPAHPVPAAFRPAPGARSDAEVREELAQMAAIQRKQYQAQLSAAAANLAGLLPWSMEPRSGVQVSVASVFTDYGLGLACGGLLGRDQLGVAHKTAPCGTLITFTYAGRSLTVPVIDRGPYIAGREWDLTGATAAALRFPGLGQIAWSVAR